MEDKKFLAEIFADLVVDTKYDNIDDETIKSAKYRLLDLVGNIIGSKVSDSSEIAIKVAEKLGGEPECTIIGSTKKVTDMNAVLANSMGAYSFDFVDDHNDSSAHISPATIPTALVLAEKYGLTGKEFMESYIVGNELIARAGSAYHGRMPYQQFHPTSVLGTMGATATACKAMKLSKEQTVNAQGIAVTSMAAGTYGWNSFPNHTKRVNTGQGARNGILAAELAKEGLIGPCDVYEGQFGAFNAFAPHGTEWSMDQAKRDIGTEWQFANSSIKPYPACRYSGGTIDACLDVVLKHDIDVSKIKSIVHSTQTAQIINCCTPMERRLNPQNMVEMQHSIPYCGAAAIALKHFGLKEIMPESLNNPVIRDLMNKTTCVADPELDKRYPEAYSSSVYITMEDGTEYKGEVYYPLGDWRNPVTDEFIVEKFMDLSSNGISDKERLQKVVDFIMNIEKYDNINELIELMNFAV